jgi:hypothetical protein
MRYFEAETYVTSETWSTDKDLKIDRTWTVKNIDCEDVCRFSFTRIVHDDSVRFLRSETMSFITRKLRKLPHPTKALHADLLWTESFAM